MKSFYVLLIHVASNTLMHGVNLGGGGAFGICLGVFTFIIFWHPNIDLPF